MINEEVTLSVNDKNWVGWKSGSVTYELGKAAGTFDLTVSERWGELSEPREIGINSQCVVKIGNDPVLSGIVDRYLPSFDKKSRTVRVTGRSQIAAAIDNAADHESGNFTGQKLDEIANQLLSPVGLKVEIKADTGDVIREFQLQQGESRYEAIERLCRLRGLLVISAADGVVQITKAGAERHESALQQGVNILSASATFDGSKQRSKVKVKAQRPVWDDIEGAKSSEVEATIVDPSASRDVTEIIIAEGAVTPDEAKKRGDWEMRRRNAQSVKAQVSVAGYRQDNGSLWSVNKRISTVIPYLRLNREMLVSSVKFNFGPGGSITEMGLTLPGAWSGNKSKSPTKEWDDIDPKAS